jgi:hypothetical protein
VYFGELSYVFLSEADYSHHKFDILCKFFQCLGGDLGDIKD